jgi:hypothetical protein
MNRYIFLGIAGMLTVLLGLSCGHATNPSATSTSSSPRSQSNLSSDVHVQGSIRSISLPELDSDLPERDGRKLVVIACASCHTTRYIMHQPPLSRQTWVAEVNKMRTTYSAPIAEENVNPIVEYLVAVRGAQ